MSCIFFSDVLQNVLYFWGECAGITELEIYQFVSECVIITMRA